MPSTTLLWQYSTLTCPLWSLSTVLSSFKISQNKKFSCHWRARLEKCIRRLLLCCHPFLINTLLSFQWVSLLVGVSGKIIWKASAEKARLAKALLKLPLFMHMGKPGSTGLMQVEAHALYNWPNTGNLLERHVSTSAFTQTIGNQQTNKIVLQVCPTMLLLVLSTYNVVSVGHSLTYTKMEKYSFSWGRITENCHQDRSNLSLYWQITHGNTGLVLLERESHSDYVQLHKRTLPVVLSLMV